MPPEPDASALTVQRLLRGDSFENETFAAIDLQGRDLGGKEFYRCTFQGAQLQESTWKQARLEACVFSACDLTRAQFSQTALREVRFEGSKLMGIDWSNISRNPELAFDGCNLRYSSFVELSLRKTPFLRCAALEVNFFDLDLTESDFAETDLTGSTFRGCTLTKTDFSRAVGAFIDPSINRVKGTLIHVESAVLLAHSLGMRVVGFGGDSSAPQGRKKSR
ncbi:pentapeptide repeat-containing protein [Myxococcaceae bacterium GXIMD 01537]